VAAVELRHPVVDDPLHFSRTPIAG
jgi:hypothetical protein